MAKEKIVKVYVVSKPEHICNDDSEVHEGGWVSVWKNKSDAEKYARGFRGYHVDEEILK